MVRLQSSVTAARVPVRCPRARVLAGFGVLALCAGLQAGCAAALGAGTIVTTGKTPVDHVYSWVTGKDCSVVRERRGATYCAEDEVVIPVQVHCYPTLGEVTCYAAPDPYPGGQRKLGSVPPSVLAARQAQPAPEGDAGSPPAPVVTILSPDAPAPGAPSHAVPAGVVEPAATAPDPATPQPAATAPDPAAPQPAAPETPAPAH